MVASVQFDSSNGLPRHVLVTPFVKEKGKISYVSSVDKIRVKPNNEVFVYLWVNDSEGWKNFYMAVHENVKKGILTEEDRLKMLQGFYEAMTDDESRIQFCRIILNATDKIIDDLMNEGCEGVSGFSKNNGEIKSHIVVYRFFKVKLQMLGIGINE